MGEPVDILSRLRGEEKQQELDSEVVTDVLSKLRKNANPITEKTESNILISEDIQPEHAAKVYDLHKRSGYDVPTVSVNPSKVEKQLSGYKAGENEQLDSYMAGSLAEGQPNTAISADDWEPLLKVHGVVEKNKGTLERLRTETVTAGGIVKTIPAAFASGIVEIPKQFGNLMDLIAPLIVDKTKLDYADKNLEKITVSGDAQEWLRGFYGETKVEELIAASFESIGTVAALVATGGGSAVPAGFAFVGGTAKAKEAKESGATDAEVVLAGAVTAGVTYFATKIPFERMTDPLKSLLNKFLVGGAFETSGEFVELVNEIYIVDQGILGREHLSRDEIKNVLIDTAIVSFISTGVISTPTHIAQKITGKIDTPREGGPAEDAPVEGEFDKRSSLDRLMPSAEEINRQVRELNKDNAFHEGLDEEHAAVQETLTQERSRDHSKEALRTFDSTENVLISSEGVGKLYQSHTDEEVTVILNNIGVDANKARATIATGEDTVVPRTEITTLTQEDYNILKDDIRESSAGHTKREIVDGDAQEEIENTSNILAEEIETQKKIDVEINRLTKELSKTKLPDAKIPGEAPRLLKGLADRLELYGKDPTQVLGNITIKRTPFAEFVERGKGLFQAPITPVDELSLQLATIETRIDKIPAEAKGRRKLVSKLEKQKADIEKRITQTAEHGFEALFQTKGTPRGHLLIDGEKKLIELFEGADLSTVLHEIGHVALLEYTALETSGVVDLELKQDMQTIREWVGNKGEPFTRPQSEQFARGFEAYLREGKAPTSALRAAFERFRHYLRNVYNTAKDLKVTLNKDVRQVFDRMVSANAEVERAARAAGFVAKTDTEMDALGMTEVDKFNAKKLIDKTVDKAAELLTRDRNRSLKEHRERWKKEAEREIREEERGDRVFGVYDAIDDMKKDDVRFSRKEYNFLAGSSNAYKTLPAKGLTTTVKDKATPLDSLATSYEFQNEDTFVEALSTTLPLDIAVDHRVTAKQVAHDAKFVVDDYISDLNSYRDYQKLMGRYIVGATVDVQAIDSAIQRNIKRWEAEAREQAEEEFSQAPKTKKKEIDARVSEIVQEKIEAFREKKAKPKARAEAELKRIAKDTMAAKTVREAQNIKSFMAQFKNASSDERRAILSKDWGAASTANELGRFSYEMASLSKDIREEVNGTPQKTGIIDRSKKAGRMKKGTLKDAYNEAILHLNTIYKIDNRSPSDPQIQPKWAELFAGDEFGFSEFTAPDFFSGTISDYRDLRMEQFRELDNAIQYLVGQGRVGKDGLLSTGEAVQDVAEKSTQDMVGHKKVHEDFTNVQKVTGASREFFAMSDRMQNVMIAYGGYQNIGAKGESSYIETQTVDRIFEADNNEMLMQEQVKADLKPHFKHIQRSIRDKVRANKKKGGIGHKILVRGAPVPEILRNRGKQPSWWTPENMFALALNTGNPSNFERILKGYPGLTEQHINTLLNELSTKDMDAVQGVWDVMESLYAAMDKVFFEMNNYHLEKIEIEPFDFKGKHYKGGYYPATYDSSLSRSVAKREEAIRIGKNENARFQNPYLKSQFTKGRTGGGLPIKLKLDVINSHFRDVIHYTTHAEVVQDVDRIIQNDTFKEAAIDALGEEVYNSLRPSLAHVASPKIAGAGIVDQLVEKHRRLASAFMVLANAGIAVKQSFSSGAAIFDVGVKDYSLGVGTLMKDPHGAYGNMMETSVRMRNRKKHFDREFSALHKSFSPEQKMLWFGDRSISKDDIKAVLGWGVRTVDMFTVTPAWIGAFEGRLKRNGGNVKEASSYADNKIRKSQPSAAPIDLPYLQRAGGVIRLLSMFQTWWLKYAERQRLHYNAVRKGAMSKSDYAWFTMIETIAPAIGSQMLMSLLWGRDLDDDEVQKDVLKDTVTQLVVNAFPLGGTFFNPYGDPLDSPVGQGLTFSKEIIIDTAEYIFGDMTKKQRARHEVQLMWDFLNVISFYSGIPVSQVAKKIVKGTKQKQGLPVIKQLIPAPKSKLD